jgi:hypothetical protein
VARDEGMVRGVRLPVQEFIMRIKFVLLSLATVIALAGACSRKEMRELQNEVKNDLKQEGKEAVHEAITGEKADSNAAGSGSNTAACQRACEVAGDAQKNPEGIAKCKADCK